MKRALLLTILTVLFTALPQLAETTTVTWNPSETITFNKGEATIKVDDNVSVILGKGTNPNSTNPTWNKNNDEIWLYAGNSVKVTTTKGKFTKVEIKSPEDKNNDGSYKFNFPTSWTFTPAGTLTAEGSTTTWIGSSNELSFNNEKTGTGDAAQVRFKNSCLYY